MSDHKKKKRKKAAPPVPATYYVPEPGSWGEAAAKAVRKLAKSGEPFTVDDVWVRLGEKGVDATGVDRRALGPVIQAAQFDGRIVKSGQVRSPRSRTLVTRWVGL